MHSHRCIAAAFSSRRECQTVDVRSTNCFVSEGKCHALGLCPRIGRRATHDEVMPPGPALRKSLGNYEA